jgi:eukaryotic-like serine/threonine-protein kinase
MSLSEKTLMIIAICMSVLAQIVAYIPETIAQNSSQAQLIDSNKNFTSDSKLSNTTGSLDFESPTHGVSMSYPSNWTLSTSGLPEYTQIIAFYSPLSNISDTIPARLSISVFSYENNISLIDFTNMTLGSLNGSQQFGIISSGPITIDSKPGYQVILSTLPSMQNPIPFGLMNTWTVAGNNLYLMSYSSDSSEFSRYLPLVEKMIGSFKIHEKS